MNDTLQSKVAAFLMERGFLKNADADTCAVELIRMIRSTPDESVRVSVRVPISQMQEILEARHASEQELSEWKAMFPGRTPADVCEQLNSRPGA